MNLPPRTRRSRALLCCAARVVLASGAASALTGCHGSSRADRHSIVVFNAGALALPLRQALDSFSIRNGLRVDQESAGSIETIRKLTDLGRVPDVIAVADTGLFSRLLPGRLRGSVAVLGGSRLVLAYTPRSRLAAEIGPQNWSDIITRPGVQVGRSDPSLDPAGYRALMAMRLAERFYRRPGLARRLEQAAPTRNIRPKSADLVALLQTGNLDYAWEYQSVAHKLGLRFVQLPPEVDLGDPALASTYAAVRVVIPAAGRKGTRLAISGAPIVFGAAVPRGAPNPDAGRRFVAYLTSSEGRSILASYGLESVATGSSIQHQGQP
jgi:molybdate/tungstate transport system substrate-binding protein